METLAKLEPCVLTQFANSGTKLVHLGTPMDRAFETKLSALAVDILRAGSTAQSCWSLDASQANQSDPAKRWQVQLLSLPKTSPGHQKYHTPWPKYTPGLTVDGAVNQAARMAACPLYMDLGATVKILSAVASQLASIQAVVGHIFGNEQFTSKLRVCLRAFQSTQLLPNWTYLVAPLVVLSSAGWSQSHGRILLVIQWMITFGQTPHGWSFFGLWTTGVLPPFLHQGV